MRTYKWKCFNGHAGKTLEMPNDKTPRLCKVCAKDRKKVPLSFEPISAPPYPGQQYFIDLEQVRREGRELK